MKKIILIAAICVFSMDAHSQWSLTGNAGTNASTNFIGTTDNIAFKIRTNNSVRMTISNGGKVGIGITSPTAKLHVKGNTDVSQLIIDAYSLQTNAQPLIRLRSSTGVDLMHIHSDNITNTFVGLNAGRVNNAFSGDGSYNSFFGSGAGYSNTSGSYNTATGFEALYSNYATGDGNTANGYHSLYSNYAGLENTACGYQSLYNNEYGNFNSAHGTWALYNNFSGENNTATGYQSLKNNFSGNNNTANGYQALYFNTSGEDNTANGYQALYSNSIGLYNTASGFQALTNNTEGESNTASGYKALYTNTTGVENTAIGVNALYANQLGASANTAVGFIALESLTTAIRNTALGGSSGNSYANGDWCTFVGAYSDVSAAGISNASAIGDGAIVNANNKVRLGDASVGVIEGQVAYSWPSDGRFKENVMQDVKGLDFILKLKPVSYNFNRLKFARHVGQFPTPKKEAILIEQSQNRSVGFIAQDVEKIIQQTGFTSFDAVHAPTNETDNYSMGYAEFVVPLVKAVQELNEKLILEAENMKLKIENLNAEIRNLKSCLKQLPVQNSITGTLFQNSPNPFSSETEIKFLLPEKFNSAQLIISDANGRQMRSEVLNGSSSIIIEPGELAAGTYTYSLVIDGITIDTKQMVIAK